MGKQFYIKTYGCQMNEYDSQKIRDLLKETHGYEPTSSPDDADLLILNTCSIREKAQEKVFSELGRWNKLKKKRTGALIAVGGCVASQEGGAVQKRAPYVDIVFGPQSLHRLPQLIAETQSKNRGSIDISFPEIEKFDFLPEPKADGPKAFVSIMEGCSKYCSFCVVPYTRGEEVSRPFDDILVEVASLAKQGVREINLLGQNVNAYNGKMADGDCADLALLIHYVAAIDGIGRIRYTTSHPIEMTDSIIRCFAEVPELASHLHLPVQSGSDHILNQMKRGHTALEYKSIIRQIKQARPGISLSSDFIIGFPGESDDDFEKTMKLIDAIEFDHSFSFIYSRRPGTPASSLADDVPHSVKQQRLSRLQQTILNNAQRYSRQMVGTTQTVLVDGVSKKSDQVISGRTENNRVVNFEGPTSLIGQFAQVTITDTLPNSLRGELVSSQ